MMDLMKNGWSVIGLEDTVLYMHMEAERERPSGGTDTAAPQPGVFTSLTKKKENKSR